MEMTLRWFSEGNDSVKLSEIRQIPGITGVVSSIDSIPVGEIWSAESIRRLKAEIEQAGLKLLGIESVNVHDSIKAATAERDKHIENYIETIKNLGENGIQLICYNFMPVFDWMRTDLNFKREDGSFAMAYDNSVFSDMSPDDLICRMESGSNGFSLPGWEPERLGRIKELFRLYSGITADKLFDNLVYFLRAIMPACEKYNVKMAIHPDDPPWPLFGLPRIIYSSDSISRLLSAVDNPCCGLTFCTGSLGVNRENDLPAMAARFADRIHFAHIRNIRYKNGIDFEESAHLTSDGSLDMLAIVRALYNGGFNGIIRPDHGRAVWGEQARPGYGLYDRAMGACYLQGMWEALEKNV